MDAQCIPILSYTIFILYNYTGHGKLLLGDGGYYEGTFVRGEMEGHGYR